MPTFISKNESILFERNRLRKFRATCDRSGRQTGPRISLKKYTRSNFHSAVLLNGDLCLLFELVPIGSEYARTLAHAHVHTHAHANYFYRIAVYGKEAHYHRSCSRPRRWNKNCRERKRVKRKRKGPRRPARNALEGTEEGTEESESPSVRRDPETFKV